MIDEELTAQAPAGQTTYESFVCTIENDFSQQSAVTYSTRRLDQFCDSRFLGDITTGRYIDLAPPIDPNAESAPSECRPWQIIDEMSLIDNEADGTESVICAVKRDFTSEFAQMVLRQNKAY